MPISTKEIAKILVKELDEIDIDFLSEFSRFLSECNDIRYELVQAYVKFKKAKSSKTIQLYKQYERLNENYENTVQRLTNIPKIQVRWKLGFPYEIELAGLSNFNKLGDIIDPLSLLLLSSLKVTSLAGKLHLPGWVKEARNLRVFDISGNKLEDIDDTLINVAGVSRLKLNNNMFTKLPPSIVKLTSLRSLNLENNSINILSPCIGALIELSRLNLKGNKIGKVPKEFSLLINLEYLNLANNKFTMIPEEMLTLKKLLELDISNNEINEIPKALLGLWNLRIYGALTNLGLLKATQQKLPDVVSILEAAIKSEPRLFYPAIDYLHMEVCAGYNSYDDSYGKGEKFDPYVIPCKADKDEQKLMYQNTSYGLMEILNMRYVSSTEWSTNDNADILTGDEFSKLYTIYRQKMEVVIGTPLNICGHSSAMKKIKIQLSKLRTGEYFEYTVWDWKGQNIYLLQSFSSGDGDFIRILWVCIITDKAVK